MQVVQRQKRAAGSNQHKAEHCTAKHTHQHHGFGLALDLLNVAAADRFADHHTAGIEEAVADGRRKLIKYVCHIEARHHRGAQLPGNGAGCTGADRPDDLVRGNRGGHLDEVAVELLVPQFQVPKPKADVAFKF
ncbi:hypothetical protein SDC9_114875 [bioreactor metagenome]|uniref:Uncharacterized protein n=1 Tax=bioreactor metagenome TaxID=1076179 RepID=A0A645BR86_9ZZZZ